MSPDAELTHLRQEVATLRKQMDDLLHFIAIETDQGAEEPRNLILRCGIAMFQNPHEPHATQIFMGGSLR